MPPVDESILHTHRSSFVFALSEPELQSIDVSLCVPQRLTFVFAIGQPELQSNLRPFNYTECRSFERSVDEPELHSIHVSHRITERFTFVYPDVSTERDAVFSSIDTPLDTSDQDPFCATNTFSNCKSYVCS